MAAGGYTGRNPGHNEPALDPTTVDGVGAVLPAPAEPREPTPPAVDADSPTATGGRIHIDLGPTAAAHVRKPDPVVWAIAAVVFAAYTAISVYKYLALQPSSWDLGIFTEAVKQYANFRAPIVDLRAPGLNLLGDHFHPIIALLGPFFRLFPSPVTLLVAQALLAAISVIPVGRAAADLLGTGASRAIAAAYGLSWGLQQLVSYDFHEVAFAVPLLACSLSALVRGKYRAAVWWAVPLVFVKEDQGFTVAAIGLLLAYAYRQRAAGLLLAGWGLAWSTLAIDVIVPYFNRQHQYWYFTAAQGQSGSLTPGHLLGQLFASPSAKLPTLALIGLVTMFATVRSPVALAAIPGLVFRFVSPVPASWGTAWHYNATVMPIVFIAAIDGLARMRAAEHDAIGDHVTWVGRTARGAGIALGRHGPAMMLAVALALAFQFPLSNLWDPRTYTPSPQLAAARAGMALVPSGATVTTDLELLAPLAARTGTYWIGNQSKRPWLGVYPANPPTQYFVLDEYSLDWNGQPPSSLTSYVHSIEPGKGYQLIFSRDGIFVYRR
jgi:uncharacterized membrane protein